MPSGTEHVSCVISETRQFTAAVSDWHSAEESPVLGRFALTETRRVEGCSEGDRSYFSYALPNMTLKLSSPYVTELHLTKTIV